MSTEGAHHSFHETKGAGGYAQLIQPKLVEKICELVSEGITDTQEVNEQTLNIAHTLSQNKSLSWWTGDITQQILKLCVQGTASMPAVKVGPPPTKNRTVAEQTP